MELIVVDISLDFWTSGEDGMAKRNWKRAFLDLALTGIRKALLQQMAFALFVNHFGSQSLADTPLISSQR
jgi:hypothetical protein